jgi:hypothetical protein
MSKRQKAKAHAMQLETRSESPPERTDYTAETNAEEMTVQQPALDQEEVRVTAYFLWEQDGRPEGRDEHYWWAAVEKIARQKSCDVLLQSDGVVPNRDTLSGTRY